MDGIETPTEELFLLVERVAQFMNLWTIYRDVLSGHYSPSVGEDKSTPVPYQMRVTVLLLVYAFFYSLVEDGDGALNAFRIWRACFPEEEAAIEAVESQVRPMLGELRVFRNRLGFHGSRTAARREPAFALFANHTGSSVWSAIVNFKALAAGLLWKQRALSQADTAAEIRARSDLQIVILRARASADIPRHDATP